MSDSHPPPWQDAPTLCANICIGPRTLDTWVAQGLLPPPRRIGGKRLWKWQDVERYLESDAAAPDAVADRIKHATRQAITG